MYTQTMALHVDYSHVFTDAKGEPPKVTVTPSMQYKIDSCVKTLEYQMKKKEAYDKGKEKFSRFKYGAYSTDSEIQTYVASDIETTLAKKKWNALDMCFKWRFIEQYLQDTFTESLTTEEINEVQCKLKTNCLLAVTYDLENRRITKLNITLKGRDC